MKNKLISLLLHVSIALCIISIYYLLIENNSIFEWIIFSLTVIGLILCIIFWKEIKIAANESSFNRLIALISLGIALIIFFQTSIQFKKNNKQFERNRIDSEELYNAQSKQAQSLNNSLIQELTEIQKVNRDQNLITEKLLIAVDKQLELSKQSLNDYIVGTRAYLAMGTIEITNIDTLSSDSVYIKITNTLFNQGKRNAEKIESRHIIIYRNAKFSEVKVRKSPFMPIEDKRELHFSIRMPIKEIENFYYWIQIRYYDEKLKQFFDNSYYYNYYKVAGTFNFYFANDNILNIMRKIVDRELERKGLSLTLN